MTETNMDEKKVENKIENKDENQISNLKDKVKQKRGRKPGSYTRKKELQAEKEKNEKIKEQCKDIIPSFCNIYNQFIDSRVSDNTIKKIWQLKVEEQKAIEQTFTPLAIKYGWTLADTMPELMFGISFGGIFITKYLMYREYKKINDKDEKND